MGKIIEKAKFIDMYASLPSLSFGKDGKVYSHLGLFLTFLTIVIIGGMAIWLGIKIFGRQTPLFIQYQVPPSEFSPKIPFNTDDFTFALTTGLGQEEEDKLISVTASYSFQNIPAENTLCEFPIVPALQFKCFAQSESSKSETYLDTWGSWLFNISIDFCKDAGTNNCYTEAEAKQKMKKADQSIFFLFDDLLVDPFNYETPVTVSPSFYSDSLFLDVGRTLIVELNEVEFISDNGWIFEDLKTETKLKATFTMKVASGDFLEVLMRYGGTKTVYKRTYPKIQDFLAQIGGFITIITPIFFILVAPYANLRAVQQMANEIYEIKLNGNQQKPPAKKKRQSSAPKSLPSKAPIPISAKPTETNLFHQKVKSKSKERGRVPSVHSENPSHVLLDIQLADKKEESLSIPHENTTPISPLETFHKSLSSPFKNSPRPTPRYDDYDTLISPEKSLVDHAQASFSERKPEDEKVDNNLEPKEEEIENNNENQSPVEEGSESEDSEEEEEEDFSLRTSDRLEVRWQDWIKSFFKPNPRVQVLTKAKEHILDTFDLVTLSKKVVEIDKLKACLLTHDERVVFENLPLSVIVLDPTADLKSEKAIQQYHWKESFKGDEDALRKAYSNLKGTQEKLGRKLIRLYKSEYLDDDDDEHAMVRQIGH